ncbi:hypothetical protein NM208_g3847 [Fusarium decemcellulare]|uniref:Uncharacterized protein n=1 Tax=Fusarium decemcellulare TaxID=57161 RepID=A0ACC1SMM2_9HYPO|nr:hypothetical protein NM208_g3847 [Fusarium decemcellulare]
MTPKVKNCLSGHITVMLEGGLLRSSARNGDTNNKLARRGYEGLTSSPVGKNTSPTTGGGKPNKGQTGRGTGGSKQTIQGTNVRGRNIGSHATAGCEYVNSDDGLDEGSLVGIEEEESETEDKDVKDIDMVDAPHINMPIGGFHPFQYQQFINNCNHNCGHNAQHLPETKVPETPPATSPFPVVPPSPCSSSTDSDGVMSLPTPIIPFTPVSATTSPEHAKLFTTQRPSQKPCSVVPDDSASVADITRRSQPAGRTHEPRTAINEAATRAFVETWSEQQLLNTIDQVGQGLVSEMIWRQKVLMGQEDQVCLSQNLHEGTNQYLDYLDIIGEVLDEKLGLGAGQGVFAQTWWWLGD